MRTYLDSFLFFSFTCIIVDLCSVLLGVISSILRLLKWNYLEFVHVRSPYFKWCLWLNNAVSCLAVHAILGIEQHLYMETNCYITCHRLSVCRSYRLYMKASEILGSPTQQVLLVSDQSLYYYQSLKPHDWFWNYGLALT